MLKYVSRCLLFGSLAIVTALSGLIGPASAQEPIRILATDVFSGPFKDLGDRYLLGVQFAVKEINEQGGINGRQIELMTEDTQLKPEVAQRRAVSQILDNDVKAILAANGTHVVKALAQVADRHKVVLVLYAGEGDSITSEEFSKSVFRVAMNTSMHSKATVNAFVGKPYKRFYLLNQDYAFGHEAAAAYKKYLDQLIPDWELVGEEYAPIGTRDFAPYIQQIAASNAEVVLTGNWGIDLTNLAAQADEFELDVMMGHYYLSDPVSLREIGDAAVGDVTSEIYMMTADTPQNKAFVERWHEANGDSDNPWPAFTIGKAYNATMFLAEAIRKAGSAEYDDLIQAFEGLEYEGLMGRMTMRACDHQVQSPVGVAEIVAENEYYSHPFIGEATIVPAEEASIPAAEVNNPRCQTN